MAILLQVLARPWVQSTDMPTPPMTLASGTLAFRTLSARLMMRRANALGVRLWLAILVLMACVLAFTYWQVRVPLDGTVRHHGVLAGVLWLAAMLGACALGAAVLSGSRMATHAARPPGPEWLALPLEPSQVEAHFRREARLVAAACFLPAAAAWLAAVGLVPAPWLILLALAFPLVWYGTTWAASSIALRRSVGADGPARHLPAAWRMLVMARNSPPPARRAASARFRTQPRWRAIAALDLLVSLRADAPRARLVGAALALALSVAVWFVSHRHPLETRALSFGAFTLACSGLGAWAAWRAASDPPSAVRPLPITLIDAWRARALPLCGVLAVALLLPLVVAMPLPFIVRLGTTITWALPALVIVFIGLHLGLSLPGKPDAAEGLLFGWLGVGLIASLAIPMFGWGLLIGALLFATRRLPRWHTPEAS